jgi:GNAT superfamily N-acetyltransferase
MSTSAAKWIARPYREGDEEGILDLWKAVYPERSYVREEWLKWWRWMYRDNPRGMGVVVLADAQGKIVSHAAEIPVMMKIGSEEVLTSIALDAMTHPDYQRQGALAALVKMRREESEKRGIRATYGFRNKYAYPYPNLATRLVMFDGATIEKVLLPVDWKAALRTQTGSRLVLALGPAAGRLAEAVVFRPRKARCPEGLSIEQIERFDGRADRLWARVSQRNRVIVVRNQQYLNWRYADPPHRRYTRLVASRAGDITGYAVFSCAEVEGTRIGCIVDVLAESGEVAECLVAAAAGRCREEKAALVWSARIAGTPLADAFRRQGFITAPRSKSIVVKGWTTSPELAAELREPGNWFLQMGDADEA